MKTLFIGKNQICEYFEGLRDSVGKFLYYQNIEGDGLLLVGEKGLMHADIEELARKNTIIEISDFKLLLGAGTCNNNSIICWESKGYKIITPMIIRRKILQVLKITDN